MAASRWNGTCLPPAVLLSSRMLCRTLGRGVTCLLGAAAALLSSRARADEVPKDIDPKEGDLAVKIPPPPPSIPLVASRLRRDLRYDLRVDIPIVLAGYVSWITLEQLRPQLAPAHCRWCDDDLNPVDRGVRSALGWKNRALARTFGDLTANALTPTASVGLTLLLAGREGKFSNAPLDVLFIAQATTFSSAANLLAKFSIGRLRPYARALPPDQRGSGRDTAVSFYSGHANYAFVIAVSSGTVASLRGYENAGYVWATGLTLATATAYFRVAADEHYLTDVLTGAATGAAFGFLFPYLLHKPVTYAVPVTPIVTPMAGGGMFGVTGLF